MNCIRCGSQIPDGARFCPTCGAEQSAAVPPQAYVPPQGYAAPTPAQPQGNVPPQPAPQGYVPPQGYAAPTPAQPQGNVPPQGYAAPTPAQPQENVPPQPAQQYTSPRQGAVPPSPDDKKKSPLRPVLIGAGVLAVLAALFFTLVWPKLRPDPGGPSAPTAESPTSVSGPTEAGAGPTTEPTTVPAGYTSPEVAADVSTDVRWKTRFTVQPVQEKPSGGKVFAAQDPDGWGDPVGIELDELSLLVVDSETLFSILVESVCSPSYLYYTTEGNYGDGLAAWAAAEAQAGDRYLFHIKNTDGEDSAWYIYDKAADMLAFLGYYSSLELYGNYLLLRPYSAVCASAPLCVFDWAGTLLHTFEDVFGYAEEEGALYLLSGTDPLSLDRIPLDRFGDVRLDVSAEHIADYPDHAGVFTRTQGGALRISLLRNDAADLRTAPFADAVRLAEEIRTGPAPSASSYTLSCGSFSVTVPAVFRDYTESNVQQDWIGLYYTAGEAPVLLYGLKLVPEEAYQELFSFDEILAVVTENGRTEYLVEVYPVDSGAYGYDAAVWEPLRSCADRIGASVRYTGDVEAVVPYYGGLEGRYENMSGTCKLRVVTADAGDLVCTFTHWDMTFQKETRVELEAKLLGGRGQLFDGSYAFGELRLEDDVIYLTIYENAMPGLDMEDYPLSRVD